MNNLVFFKLPTENSAKVEVIDVISESLKGNYWGGFTGALFAPEKLAGTVTGMGYSIGYGGTRSEPNLASPQMVARKDHRGSNFPGIIKGGLPEFLEFRSLDFEREKVDGPLSVLELLDVTKHFVGLGYKGWFNLYRNGFQCTVILHDWSYENNGLWGINSFNAVLDREALGTQPARVALVWPDSHRNDCPSTEKDGVITRPVIKALRKLGLEEYVPQPVTT